MFSPPFETPVKSYSQTWNLTIFVVGERWSRLSDPICQHPSRKHTPTNKKLDEWLKLSKRSKAGSEQTPTRRPLTVVTNKHDQENEPVDQFWNRQWHPSDFIVNPDFNDNLPYAYRETVRGAKRQCEHGVDCRDCTEVWLHMTSNISKRLIQFYKAAGPGLQPAGPQWSSAANKENDGVRATINMVSRHRNRWQRQVSPPGFWRSEFPNTQEAEEDKKQMKQYRDTEAKKRLAEAMKGGKWLFRDPALRKRAEEQKQQHMNTPA